MGDAPTAADLLRMWENGDGLSPPEQALLALGPSLPDTPLKDLTDITVGERTARLLAARQALSGPFMNCLVTCPSCRQTLEFQETTHNLLEDYRQPTEREFELEHDGIKLRCRLLNSADLIAAADQYDWESAREALIRRCIISAQTSTGDPAKELPLELMVALADAVETRDPLSNITIPLRCDNCSHIWRAGFDVMAFLWAEIVRKAKTTLEDVRAIARSYGWAEAEILSLSPARRAFYLEDPP